MKNNWENKVKELFEQYKHSYNFEEGDNQDLIDEEDFNICMLQVMNLVFEATKKKCTEEAECDWVRTEEGKVMKVIKRSILNIEKPNL